MVSKEQKETMPIKIEFQKKKNYEITKSPIVWMTNAYLHVSLYDEK